MSLGVSILTNIPTPHRLALFRELARRLEIQVIFDAPSAPHGGLNVNTADSGFRHVYASSVALHGNASSAYTSARKDGYLQVSYNALRHLRSFRPGIVVSTETGARSLQAELYCRLAGIPLVIWNEGTAHSEGWVSGNKRRLRRHFIRSAVRFWTAGQESTRLLESYGAPRERIDPGITAADTNLFVQKVDDRYRHGREVIRRSLGLEGTAFCFIGELTARKGIHEFLEAIRCLNSVSTRPFSVLFGGDGPERNGMEKWSRSNRIPLVITGFRPQTELPELYAAADIFVMPTLEDNWAQASLEAALAGLPQIFSRFNGATTDLIAAGAQGVVVNPYDISSLTAALENYTISTPDRASHAVRNRLGRIYSPEACAGRICASIERAVGLKAGSLAGGAEVPIPVLVEQEERAHAAH
jgi:glycosyltransferase involved in cell wall biosynthesis